MRGTLSALALLAMLGGFGGAGAQAATITCNASAQGMCGEYNLPDDQADSFWQQCQSMGSSPSQGANCAAAPNCSQSQGNISVTTYVYGMSADQVQQSCVQNGGRFNGG